MPGFEQGQPEKHSQSAAVKSRGIDYTQAVGTAAEGTHQNAVKGDNGKVKRETSQPAKVAAKANEQQKPAKTSEDSWWTRMAHNFSEAATGLEHTVEKEVSDVENFAGNLADVGIAVGKGTLKSGQDLFFSIEHGIEHGAQWVYHNPGKTAAIVGGAVLAVGAEVATGGLATPLLAAAATTVMPVVEGAGVIYTAVKVAQTVDKVAKHGEIGTIFHQQELNKTAAGRAKVQQAKDELAKDTGSTAFLLAGAAVGTAVMKLPFLRRSAAATAEVGDGAAATGRVAATKKAVDNLLTTGKTVNKATKYASGDWLGHGVGDGPTGKKIALPIHH